MEGTASFAGAPGADGPSIQIKHSDGSTKELKGKKVVLAAGGVPDLPEIPGAEHAITSDGFFELKEQPKKVAVVGAGYIAVEMVGILHALGSETHLFYRGETVLRRGFDPFIVETLMQEMTHHGPNMHKLSQSVSIVKGDDGLMTFTVCENGE